MKIVFTKKILKFLIALIFLSKFAYADQIVTDQLGRKIKICDKITRIVSLAPSITEIIYDLKCENLLKGVTIHSNYPLKALKLPKIGSYVHPNLEKIVALNPALCFATKNGNPKNIVERLTSFNIPVYVTDSKNYNSVMEMITDMGKILKATETANKIVSNMNFRINKIKNKIAKTNLKPKVLFAIGLNPVISVGTNTFINQMIDITGGINLGKGSISYPRLTMEQIITLAPDIIIFSSMEKNLTKNQIINNWKKWSMIPAVKNNKLYFTNSDLFNRPSPRSVSGLEILAKIIHPKLF